MLSLMIMGKSGREWGARGAGEVAFSFTFLLSCPSHSRAFGLVSEWLGASLVLPPLSCPAARGVARVLASRAPLWSVAALPASPPSKARVLGHVIGWLVSCRGVSVVLSWRWAGLSVSASGRARPAPPTTRRRARPLPPLAGLVSRVGLRSRSVGLTPSELNVFRFSATPPTAALR